MKKGLLVSTVLAGLFFSGCATTNMFGVGYEKSTCENSAKGGFCGSPSAIYKNKKVVKQVQEDYRASGYPDDLFFSIRRDGKILVKAERDDKWQPYDNSRYQEEINELLKAKFGGSSIPGTSGSGFSGTNNLAKIYQEKMTHLRTTTNVGQMIRDNGKYTRTWVAPYVDTKGDLVSAHELYIVLEQPKWVVGEKTPTKTLKAATPTPMSGNILGKSDSSRQSEVREIPPRSFKSNKKYDLDKLQDFLNE